ncbi:MAG: hypothetical protein AAF547_10700, partial [Actinomycetota bacterium]
MPAAINHVPLSVHAHGVPNWIDLHTASIADARRFYEALLGWSFQGRLTLASIGRDEADVGEDAASVPTTAMARIDGGPAAEFIERGESYGDMALLSNWIPYVYVDDLNEMLSLVEAVGGLVASPPARRGDMAMVATIIDPNDAPLCLWQPLSLTGAAIHRPGALTWIELETPDVDIAAKFYGELFGWDADEVGLSGTITDLPVEVPMISHQNLNLPTLVQLFDGIGRLRWTFFLFLLTTSISWV